NHDSETEIAGLGRGVARGAPAPSSVQRFGARVRDRTALFLPRPGIRSGRSAAGIGRAGTPVAARNGPEDSGPSTAPVPADHEPNQRRSPANPAAAPSQPRHPSGLGPRQDRFPAGPVLLPLRSLTPGRRRRGPRLRGPDLGTGSGKH